MATRARKRARKLMRSGSRKLRAFVRSHARKNPRRKRAAQKNPVKVGAKVVGSGTGWIKAKAVKIRKSGSGYVVDVKR